MANFFEIADDIWIDLDKMIDIIIIDLSKEYDTAYHVLFSSSVIEDVKYYKNFNVDEKIKDTSWLQSTEYNYKSYLSKPFNDYIQAEAFLKKAIRNGAK